jgi:hypothetical protein
MPRYSHDRRAFVKQLGLATAGLGLASYSKAWAQPDVGSTFFQISLAEFSFATSLWTGKMNHLDFASRAKKEFGISNVEYVSGFWKEKPTNTEYLKEMKKRSDDSGVRNVLIMVDGAGELGAADKIKRDEAVDNHAQWIEGLSNWVAMRSA